MLERRLAMEAVPELDALMSLVGMVCSAWTVDHARLAHAAFLRCGKGRHPARLNMGDCFSYACAKVRRMPLLYSGNHFAQTDLA